MANKYYKDQTLIVELTSNLDISSATNVIKYINPYGKTGTLTPTVADGNYIVKYTNIFTTAGDWRLWIYSDFGSGVIIPSTSAKLHIDEEGS